ncbi:hypothetical protein Tco_1204873 [Tanacetum coccineum]
MFGRNRQYSWDTTSPAYEAPQPRNIHLVSEDDRIMIEEERPIASYYPERVSAPVHKNHHPRKHVHFVEHKEKVAESFDSFGNHKVYKENVDSEADGFIQLSLLASAFLGERNGLCVFNVPAIRLGFRRNTIKCKESRIRKQPIEAPSNVKGVVFYCKTSITSIDERKGWNSSIGLCQCEKDDWLSLQDGFWSSSMSPYERKYVDVKFGGKAEAGHLQKAVTAQS